MDSLTSSRKKGERAMKTPDEIKKAVSLCIFE
jgi:hypothetical protein